MLRHPQSRVAHLQEREVLIALSNVRFGAGKLLGQAGVVLLGIGSSHFDPKAT